MKIIMNKQSQIQIEVMKMMINNNIEINMIHNPEIVNGGVMKNSKEEEEDKVIKEEKYVILEVEVEIKRKENDLLII